MNKLLIVTITCKNEVEAEKIGRHLLVKRLAACVKIMPPVHSLYLWPPKSGKIEEANEVMLIVKTLESKWKTVEKEVLLLHSYKNPEIYALPASFVSQKYLKWLSDELS